MTDIESVIRKATSSNADIIERQHAFGELVKRFQDMAYGYAYAILGDYGLAEDAAQEAFLAAYQMLKQLREAKAFPGWLKRIVRTQCHRIVRRNGVPTEPIEAAWELPSTALNPIEKVLRQEQTDLVNAAILGLPEDERTVTTLFYINRYSQREISDFLQIPQTTVNSRLHYSRKRLKERMLMMVQENLQTQRPSKDKGFANRVQFFNAIESGNFAAVSNALAMDANLLSAPRERTMSWTDEQPIPMTPLHIAAAFGQERIVHLLIDSGADVNGPRTDGKTPLHIAVREGQKEIVEFLLKKGANPNAKDNDGKTPIHDMFEHAVNFDIIRLLARNGTDLNTTDGAGATVLQLVSSRLNERVGTDYPRFVEILLEEGAELDIFTAIAQNRANAVNELLKTDPSQVNACLNGTHHPHGTTPLHLASDWGFSDIMRLLIVAGADVNARDKGDSCYHANSAPLHRALCVGREEAARILLEGGADVNAKNGRGKMPMHYAVSENAGPEVIGVLLEYGADVNPMDDSGESPLTLTVRNHHGEELAELMLERAGELDIFTDAVLGNVEQVTQHLDAHPSLVNARSEFGATPLHRAVWANQSAVIELLLSREADINAKDQEGRTPLNIAQRRGHTALAIELIERGAAYSIFTATKLHLIDRIGALLKDNPSLVNAKDSRGDSLLSHVRPHWYEYQSVSEEKSKVAEFLIAHGAELDIWTAAGLGRCEVVEQLLDETPLLVNAYDQTGTPLHYASVKGHTDVVKLLIERGAGLDAKNCDGQGPLFWTLWNAPQPARKEIAELMVRAGANPSALDSYNDTPLYLASYQEPEVAELMLEQGAELDILSACNLGKRSVVETLLDESPDQIHTRDFWAGSTPLHEAARHGHLDVVRLLIERGADVNASQEGHFRWLNTPLHLAVEHGYASVVDVLLQHDADANAENSKGITALQCATEKGHQQVINLLRDK